MVGGERRGDDGEFHRAGHPDHRRRGDAGVLGGPQRPVQQGIGDLAVPPGRHHSQPQTGAVGDGPSRRARAAHADSPGHASAISAARTAASGRAI